MEQFTDQNLKIKPKIVHHFNLVILLKFAVKST